MWVSHPNGPGRETGPAFPASRQALAPGPLASPARTDAGLAGPAFGPPGVPVPCQLLLREETTVRVVDRKRAAFQKTCSGCRMAQLPKARSPFGQNLEVVSQGGLQLAGVSLYLVCPHVAGPVGASKREQCGARGRGPGVERKPASLTLSSRGQLGPTVNF